jgi:hypothetical protein
LRSQFATSNGPRKDGRGGPRYRPFAFTEHGAITAAACTEGEVLARMKGMELTAQLPNASIFVMAIATRYGACS